MKRLPYWPALRISWLVLGFTAFAIVLGRGKSERTDRHPVIPRYYSLIEHLLICGKHRGHLLDSATGRFVRIPLLSQKHVLNAVGSPWCDDRGRSHMVGILHESGGEAKVGLIRYTMPDGEVLDEVDLEVTPMGRPCWYPGTAARILFVAGDGQLYRLSFEETLETCAIGFDDVLRPRLLAWRTDPLEPGTGRLSDLVWPTDPRMEGRIVVSVRFTEQLGDYQQLKRSQLWWLRIGADGTTIEGRGRLTVPTPGVAEEERLSAFSPGPDGRLIVAYLTRREGLAEWRWQLRLAPVVFDGRGGNPQVMTASSVILGDDCATGPATFSSDGRWVYALVGRSENETRIVRYSVADAMRRFDQAGREADRGLDHPDALNLALDQTLMERLSQ